MSPGKAPSVMQARRGTVALPPTATGAVAAAFVAAYVALEWISFIHEYEGLPVTPWNPGTGLALALMIFAGARFGLALFAAIIIAEYAVVRSALDWPAVLGVAAIISAGYAAAAALLRHRLVLDVVLPHLHDVLVLLAAGTGAAVIVSLLLTSILVVIGPLEIADAVFAAAAFLVGDVIGIAVMTPLLLRLADHWRKRTARAFLPFLPELAALGGGIALALWLIAGAAPAEGARLFYVLFLPVVVAAVRYGLDGACLSLAATQIGLVGLLHRYGYDAAIFREFQTLMFVLTVTGLIVGVVVSERREAQRAARAAEARFKEMEAEAAHASRASLLSGMASALAHEINQPMAAARALARSAQELLRGPARDPERAERNLATLLAEIDLASGIVRRMRDFLRRGRPHFSTIDTGDLIGDALMLARPDAASRRIAIEVKIESELPQVFGDRIQLQQVLLNLVRNSVEALAGGPRPDGRIRIGARRSDDSTRVEICVADNGPGVAPEVAARLFEPLTTSKSEGLGLGLSICASILEAHGGRIWLHENRPGATEFRFALPVEPLAES